MKTKIAVFLLSFISALAYGQGDEAFVSSSSVYNYATYLAYPGALVPVTINGLYIDNNSVSNNNLSADVEAELALAQTAVQPSQIANLSPTLVVTNVQYVSGNWYSNSYDVPIIVHTKGYLTVAPIAGSIEADAWTSPSSNGVHVVSDWFGQSGAVALLVNINPKASMSQTVPAHFWFCPWTNAVVSGSGNSSTLSTSEITVLPY